MLHEEILFKDISLLSSGGNFVQQCGAVCTILVGSNIRETLLLLEHKKCLARIKTS